MEPQHEATRGLSWAEIRQRTLPLRRHKIGPAAYLCYLELFFLAGGVAGTITVTLAELGAAFCKSARAADKWIELLVEAGLIEVVANDRGALRLFVEMPEQIEQPTRIEPSPQLEIPFAEEADSDDSAQERPSDTDHWAQERPDDSAQKGPTRTIGRRNVQPPAILAFPRAYDQKQVKKPERHEKCEDVTSSTSTSKTSSGGSEKGGIERGAIRLGDAIPRRVDAYLAACEAETSEDPIREHYLVGQPPGSPHVTQWAKQLQGIFLANGDRKMQLGPCKKIARLIAAGTLPYADFTRIKEWAFNERRSGRRFSLGGSFLQAIKNKLRELGHDWESDA